MDNIALLILKHIMHTITIFFTKENISRYKSFKYKKIKLNSELIYIKTLKFILAHNHRAASKGH